MNIIDHIQGKSPWGVSRSPKWDETRKTFLCDHPECAVCNTRKGLEVHHELPFHIAPALELDPTNLITLCRDHHFLFGHLLDWKSFNETVKLDARTWNSKILERP
jgi:5-methylcytosine-specific restriction endonuclease McrA